MKYLYGDSVPSPIRFDFLTAFETFVDVAVKAVRIEQEIGQAQAAVDLAVEAREEALSIVESFHQKVMVYLDALLDEQQDPNTSVYVRQLREHGDKVVAEARNNCRVAMELAVKERGAEFGARRNELMSLIERFLITELVTPVHVSSVMRLSEGQNQMTTIMRHPGGIVATYSAVPVAGSVWQGPVRLASLVQDLDLQLGTRKSWITGSVAKSAVSLDDFIVGGFELADESAEIRLRKRVDQADSFQFNISRQGEKLLVQVERKGEAEADAMLDLDEGERLRIEKLWQMLRQSVRNTVRSRGGLLSVTMDGEDLWVGRGVRVFFNRIVEHLAPTVTQIIQHSPNPAELSMKIENEEGRREEVYVRRQSLMAKIESLDDDGRSVFSPFGLAGDELTSEDVDIV
ncbi:MAG TPA: hypothetical protein PKL73_12455 [Polyangiaceae bacterium]|nr:hypothetical protein [Polyangiaceae bacterium]